jgi:hypothetical protein
MPPNTLKVDRTTRWGNPFRVAPGYSASAAQADFVRWLDGGLTLASAPPSGAEIRAALRGHNLACWCKPGAPCHAEILLLRANPRATTRRGSSK